MPRITLLELQRRRSDRVNVHLDGEFAFGLPLALASSLRKGQLLTPSEIESLRAADRRRHAVEAAGRFLANRPHSRAELARKLGRKGMEEQAIRDALDVLASKGYVDDEAFARWWVQNRTDHRPRGRYALRSELAQRGVAREDMETALANVDDVRLARDLAVDRAHRYRGLDRDDFDRKLGAYLRRRGFKHDAVRRALAAAWAELDGHGLPEDPHAG